MYIVKKVKAILMVQVGYNRWWSLLAHIVKIRVYWIYYTVQSFLAK